MALPTAALTVQFGLLSAPVAGAYGSGQRAKFIGTLYKDLKGKLGASYVGEVPRGGEVHSKSYELDIAMSDAIEAVRWYDDAASDGRVRLTHDAEQVTVPVKQIMQRTPFEGVRVAFIGLPPHMAVSGLTATVLRGLCPHGTCTILSEHYGTVMSPVGELTTRFDGVEAFVRGPSDDPSLSQLAQTYDIPLPDACCTTRTRFVRAFVGNARRSSARPALARGGAQQRRGVPLNQGAPPRPAPGAPLPGAAPTDARTTSQRKRGRKTARERSAARGSHSAAPGARSGAAVTPSAAATEGHHRAAVPVAAADAAVAAGAAHAAPPADAADASGAAPAHAAVPEMSADVGIAAEATRAAAAVSAPPADTGVAAAVSTPPADTGMAEKAARADAAVSAAPAAAAVRGRQRARKHPRDKAASAHAVASVAPGVALPAARADAPEAMETDGAAAGLPASPPASPDGKRHHGDDVTMAEIVSGTTPASASPAPPESAELLASCESSLALLQPAGTPHTVAPFDAVVAYLEDGVVATRLEALRILGYIAADPARRKRYRQAARLLLGEEDAPRLSTANFNTAPKPIRKLMYAIYRARCHLAKDDDAPSPTHPRNEAIPVDDEVPPPSQIRRTSRDNSRPPSPYWEVQSSARRKRRGPAP